MRWLRDSMKCSKGGKRPQSRASRPHSVGFITSLSHQQRLDVETMVTKYGKELLHLGLDLVAEAHRPSALWLGGHICTTRRRFVRILQRLPRARKLSPGDSRLTWRILSRLRNSPKGRICIILDAALVESGLANDWISTVTKSDEIT